MILENWQIKVLQHQLLDYEEWINHVENYPKFANNYNEIIQNKIDACFEIMKLGNPLDFTGLTDEQIVNLITSQQDYKNRTERENEI
jgi:hypothetical protein